MQTHSSTGPSTGTRGGGNGVDGRAAHDIRDGRRVRSGRADAGPDRGQDPAGRPVVAVSTGHLRRVLGVRGLRDLAGLPGRQLLRRAVPLAVLLALPDRRLCDGRRRGLRDAVRLVEPLPGADHPDLPARLPDELLLLPQGLLPGVLAVAARVCRRRAAPEVHGRDPVPADPAEHPPLLLVRRGGGRADPDLGRPAGVRPGRGRVRRDPHGPRHGADGRERRADLALHAVVPLVPAHHRRPAAPLLEAPGPLQDVDLRLEAEHQPRGLRLVLPVLRRRRGLLHLPAGDQRLRRPEVLRTRNSTTGTR